MVSFFFVGEKSVVVEILTHDGRYGKPAGLFMTSIVYIVYKIALCFEE